MSSFTPTSFSSLKPGTWILIASMPCDGHFDPLTGPAYHLKSIGCDVRWYTPERYKARDSIAGLTSAEMILVREKHKTAVGKFNYDIIIIFILRGAEFYKDIKEIYQHFPYKVIVANICFTGRKKRDQRTDRLF